MQTLNDYLLIYFRDKDVGEFNLKVVGQKKYPYADERGEYYIVPLQDNGPHGTKAARPNLWYPIYQQADGKFVLEETDSVVRTLLPGKHQNRDGCWMWSKAKFERDSRDLVLYNGQVYIKHYHVVGEDQNKYQREKLWLEDFQNAKGTAVLNTLFTESKNLFNNPKPVELLRFCLNVASDKDSVVLDFFSGSATTAHAVMQLNAEDGGHRKFIMVQWPELCDEKSEAYKAGYKNICEIGKERIRRAGVKIKEDNSQATADLDIGFRVFKLDESNMNDVYYSAGEYDQGMLSMLESNVKPNRTDLDLLFGCLLDWGLPLSLPYTSEKIDGCTVHTYNDGDLIACFDENIPDSVIKAIAKRQPLRAVFRDSSFASSPAKINVGEIFKMLAPDTRVRVI